MSKNSNQSSSATTAPAVVPASEVWELVETLERSHRSAESDTFWNEADKALTDYHSKHPKPEAK